MRPSSPYTTVEHVELFKPSNDLQTFNCIRSMPSHLVKPQIWEPHDKIDPTKVSKRSRAILGLTLSSLQLKLAGTKHTIWKLRQLKGF